MSLDRAVVTSRLNKILTGVGIPNKIVNGKIKLKYESHKRKAPWYVKVAIKQAKAHGG